MVVGKLLSAPLSSNLSYLRGRTHFPLRALTWGPHTKVDTIFQDLKDSIEPPSRITRAKTSWISDETWNLVDTHTLMHCDPNMDRAAFQHLNQQVQATAWKDHTRHMEEATEAIDMLLSDDDIKGAWSQLKAWYKQISPVPHLVLIYRVFG